LFTKGAFVAGTTGVMNQNGERVFPAEEAGIIPGDIILQVQGVDVWNSEHLSELINQHTHGATLSFTISRGGKKRTVDAVPVQESDHVYRMGMWVRDSSAGVGTLSFYDPASGRFGALGHGITDVDTGNLLELREGKIIVSKVVDVVQGKRGTPGELKGIYMTDQQPLGQLSNNNQFGVFGTAHDAIQNPLYDALPMAHASVVHTGNATILTTINENGIAEYDIEIMQVRPDKERSLVVKVTDPALLEITGGIVQGMSGSPIIQDGCIVGVVTHVFVNDPTKGYGVFIEQMLDHSQ